MVVVAILVTLMTMAVVLALLAVLLWPVVIILRRMGFSGWWALLIFAPFGSIIGLWIVSQTPWPKLEGHPDGLLRTFD